MSISVISLLISILAIYFEQFTFLKFDLPLVTLGCKPLVIDFSKHRSSLVVLIKFSLVFVFLVKIVYSHLILFDILDPIAAYLNSTSPS